MRDVKLELCRFVKNTLLTSMHDAGLHAPLVDFQSRIETECLAHVHHIITGYLGKKLEELHRSVSWPADWWQHFRQRWFPRWWLAKHPVVMKEERWTERYYNLCPHVRVDWVGRGGREVHLKWIDETE